MNTLSRIRKNWKDKLIYAAFGSFFTLIGTTISFTTAQQSIPRFDEVKCSKLTVVGPDGKRQVEITGDDIHGGTINVFGPKRPEELVRIDADEHGGNISVFGYEDKYTRVIISINDDGDGVVNTWNKAGYRSGKLHSH